MNDQPLITKELLDELGIDLNGQDEATFLQHLNDTLDERVGAEITEALNDEQLQELLDLQEKGSDEEVGAWLEKNVEDLQQIVQDEIDILLGELAENADDVNKAA